MAQLKISQILGLIEYSVAKNSHYLLLPVKAIKVKISGRFQPISILEQTVLRLKNLDMDKDVIAEKLCLDAEIVDTIIDAYKEKNIIKNGKVSDKELEQYKQSITDDILNSGYTEAPDAVGYVFYSYVTSSLIKNVFMYEEEFNRRKRFVILDELCDSNHMEFKKSISDSIKYSATIVKTKEPSKFSMEKISEIDLYNVFSDSFENIKIDNLLQNEDIYMQLKYRISDDFDILVETPITNNNSSFAFFDEEDNIDENNADINFTSQINKALEFNGNENLRDIVKKSIQKKESSTAKISESMKTFRNNAREQVLNEYSKNITEVQGLLERLISFQTAYNCLNGSINNEHEFYVTMYELLEMMLFTTFSVNYSGELNLEKLKFIDVLADSMGLHNEEYNNKLFRFVSKSKLNALVLNKDSIYEKGKDTFDIRVTLAACIMNATDNKKHPIRILCERMPELVEYILILKEESRDLISHGDGDKAGKFNVDNLYNGIRRIMKCLFPEYCIHKKEEIVEKTEKINIVLNEVEKKVEKQLEGLSIDHEIKDKLGEMYEAFYKHSPQFYKKVDITLSALFDYIMGYAKGKGFEPQNIYSLFNESSSHNERVVKEIINKHSPENNKVNKIWRINNGKLKNMFSKNNVLSVKATYAIVALNETDSDALTRLFYAMPNLIKYTTFIISPNGRGHSMETDFSDENVDFMQIVEDIKDYCVALNSVVDVVE